MDKQYILFWIEWQEHVIVQRLPHAIHQGFDQGLQHKSYMQVIWVLTLAQCSYYFLCWCRQLLKPSVKAALTPAHWHISMTLLSWTCLHICSYLCKVVVQRHIYIFFLDEYFHKHLMLCPILSSVLKWTYPGSFAISFEWGSSGPLQKIYQMHINIPLLILTHFLRLFKGRQLWSF